MKLYSPLLYTWAHRLGMHGPDAADLVQDVFLTLVQKLPEFQYDQRRSFRSWLQTVTLNKWRDRGRRRMPAALAPDDRAFTELPAAETEPFGEAEYRQVLVTRRFS